MPSPSVDWTRLDTINRLTTVARLLSTVVHDAGNSLQIIAGHAELLQTRPDDAERVLNRARIIATQAERTSVTLRELVSLVGGPSGEPRRLDLRAIAADALGVRAYGLGRAGIASSLEPAAGEFYIRGDRAALVRLIVNLIFNAEDALGRQPGGTVALTLGRHDASVTVTVTDNGPGLSPERARTVFDAFNGSDRPGLGLCVARGLAERDGGTLEADTARAAGAAFTLTLPEVA